MLSVSSSRCAFPIPRDTEALLLLLLLLLLPTVIYRSPISRSDNSLLFSARLTFSFFFSPPVVVSSLSLSSLPVPLYPLYFLQRARAIGILTTREGALSSPRYPDPDGCEISRTRLARAVNRVDYLLSQRVSDISTGKRMLAVHNFFFSLLLRFSPFILDPPRIKFSRDSTFRNCSIRNFPRYEIALLRKIVKIPSPILFQLFALSFLTWIFLD